MVKLVNVAFISISLLEIVYLCHGKMYTSKDICEDVSADQNDVKRYSGQVRSDAKQMLKTITNWNGKEKWQSFCPLKTEPERDYKLHTAIAVLLKYTYALREKYQEAGKLFKSAGCDCKCMEEPQGLTKIRNTYEDLCWLYRAVENDTRFNGNFSISFDSVNIVDIDIKDSFSLIKSFSHTINKSVDSSKKINRYVDKVLFKGCKGTWKKNRREERRERRKKERKNKGH